MVTLSSCLIWQIISFILTPNKYGCGYAWTTLPKAIDLKKIPILAKKITLSDEAHFDLGGYVNKQNCRLWGTENPYAYIVKPTHAKRVTVWCGFWFRGIIGPFFFKNEGDAVRFNGNRFRAMLNEFLFTQVWLTYYCLSYFPNIHQTGGWDWRKPNF